MLKRLHKHQSKRSSQRPPKESPASRLGATIPKTRAEMSENIFCDLYLSLLTHREHSTYVFAVLKTVHQLYGIQMLQRRESAAQFGSKEGSDLKVGLHFDYF
ncbi:uncharacterized protein V6R79_002683 [Siganus canaliculatus]